jgi:membrane-associated phospholipid phosphatase
MPAMDSATKPQMISDLAWRWAVPLLALCGMVILFLTGDNVALFLFINRATAHIPDAIWGHLTVLGDSTIAILFILPFFHRRPDIVWKFILAAMLTALLVFILKDPSNVRPPGVLAPDSFHIVGPVITSNSFPSGHTATIFLLAGLFCMQRINTWIKTLLLLLAVLVGLSRIACGVHWPMDVLGGALGGWLAASAGIWIAARWQAGLNIQAQRAFALIIIVLGTWSTWYYDKGFPDTWPLQSAIIALIFALSARGLWRLFKGA